SPLACASGWCAKSPLACASGWWAKVLPGGLEGGAMTASRWRSLVLAGVVGLALSAPLLRGEDPLKDGWPVFRGNAGQTGVADALPDKLELLWKVQTGDSSDGGTAIAGAAAQRGLARHAR